MGISVLRYTPPLLSIMGPPFYVFVTYFWIVILFKLKFLIPTLFSFLLLYFRVVWTSKYLSLGYGYQISACQHLSVGNRHSYVCLNNPGEHNVLVTTTRQLLEKTCFIWTLKIFKNIIRRLPSE